MEGKKEENAIERICYIRFQSDSFKLQLKIDFSGKLLLHGKSHRFSKNPNRTKNEKKERKIFTQRKLAKKQFEKRKEKKLRRKTEKVKQKQIFSHSIKKKKIGFFY